jgi:hypothetical protein
MARRPSGGEYFGKSKGKNNPEKQGAVALFVDRLNQTFDVLSREQPTAEFGTGPINTALNDLTYAADQLMSMCPESSREKILEPYIQKAMVAGGFTKETANKIRQTLRMA